MGDWSGGCVREKVLTCSNGIQENFLRLENVKPPDHTVLLNNKSLSECESECQQNCSCTAYAYVNGTNGSTGKCLAWFGELLDLVENQNTGTHDVYIRVHGSELGTKGLSFNSLKQTLVIAIVSAAVGLLTITFGYFLWKKKWVLLRLSDSRRIARRVSENVSKVSAGDRKNDTELPLFSLRSILAATNTYSEDNKLGEGGFGPVYKGVLPENQEVAVKRLSKKYGQGHHEFMNELKLIAKLQHTNLARLLGCCMEEDELILVYEYMPNRSLDKFLFDRFEKTKLDKIWELWKEGRGMEAIDASVRETCRIHEAFHVGILCVQEAPADRPTMSSVIHMLEVDEATSLPPSKEPAFSTSWNLSSVITCSENAVTITLPEPR
uniref:G-type lectin S-receptor-like serine/threonine-protein kinase B120 n=1 Tax=Fragaria vesca subsp. vesca TaxID=101020 RepID=UPI0005CA3BB7|nr:PREDICTED: G-type lectin S-receptor-like serine/threonine-protein kinase B120 [Fragaria vesca subsp. vesca]